MFSSNEHEHVFTIGFEFFLLDEIRSLCLSMKWTQRKQMEYVSLSQCYYFYANLYFNTNMMSLMLGCVQPKKLQHWVFPDVMFLW